MKNYKKFAMKIYQITGIMFCTLYLCSNTGWTEFIVDGVTLIPLTDDGKTLAGTWVNHGDRLIKTPRK